MSDDLAAHAAPHSPGKITVTDGGMGKELRRIGAPFRQPEWSALALMEAPEFVVTAHRNFIEAGAELIITNNYAVVPYHLGDERFTEVGADLLVAAGRLARQAADESDRPVLVAGSLPPLFGSYEPELFDASRAPAIYETIVRELEPFVDLWVAETLSLVDEMTIIATAVDTHGGDKPLWTGFALPEQFDGGVALRSGDTVADIVDAVGTRPHLIDAVLFNCSLPEQIGPALVELIAGLQAAGLDVRTGAYANAFPETRHDPQYTANNTILERRDDMTPQRYGDITDEWVRAGASIIGGCCDMYPEHIAALAERHS